MNELYTFMEQYLATGFDGHTLLKNTERSKVYRIRNIKSHRYYIYRSFTGSAQAYRKLLDIRNSHLPQVYEAVQEQEHSLVLEEYIQGDNLYTILEGGILDEKDVQSITLQLCDALYALHGLGLVHRDVKPSNILINGDHAYLIDFDAARQNSSEKLQDTHILGTTGYAPPEQYGISQTDARSDIYAMGVLINEMLTLKHPSVQLAEGRWARIVQRCTMVNPEKRYRDIRALMNAL